ncbi:MAG: PEGA domain-containing protein [Betaproteobacteria bacterium]
MRKALFCTLPIACLLILSGAAGIGALETESDLVIVKYGKVVVKSSIPEAKVYVDDVYKGPADTVIENIMVGAHTISCRAESRAVAGTFTVKKDETLRLEARYHEGKLAPLIEHEKVEIPEPEKKPKKVEAPKPEKPKPEKPKKAVVEVKKEEKKKDPVEERRELYLNIVKIFFEDMDAQEVHISHKTNPKVISKYTEKKHQAGTYYRTKQNVMLCDAGPCEEQWSSSFVYTDETGKSDTFSFTWKKTVFNGITPAGTSKRELLYCLNGACKTLEDTAAADTRLDTDAGRYHFTWSKTSLVIRRSDIMKEIVDAGGLVEAY